MSRRECPQCGNLMIHRYILSLHCYKWVCKKCKYIQVHKKRIPFK